MGNVEAATVRGKGKRQEYDWKTIFISAANMSDKSKWSGSKGAWLHRTHSHTHSHTHMQASCKGTISKSIFMTAPADLLQLAMRVPNSPRSSWILFSIFHFCAFPIFFFFAHCCCCFLPSSQNNNMPCLIFVCERISIYCLGVFVHCLVYDTAAFDDLCILNKMSANGRI